MLLWCLDNKNLTENELWVLYLLHQCNLSGAKFPQLIFTGVGIHPCNIYGRDYVILCKNEQGLGSWDEVRILSISRVIMPPLSEGGI